VSFGFLKSNYRVGVYRQNRGCVSSTPWPTFVVSSFRLLYLTSILFVLTFDFCETITFRPTSLIHNYEPASRISLLPQSSVERLCDSQITLIQLHIVSLPTFIPGSGQIVQASLVGNRQGRWMHFCKSGENSALEPIYLQQLIS